MDYVWVISLAVLLGTNFLLAQNQGSSSSNPSWDPNPQFGNSGGGGGGGGQSGNNWGTQNNGWSNPSSQSSNPMMEAANMAAMMSLAGMGGNSGGGSMGGMGGMGGLGAMSGMMNPMSLMLSMQASRMGDNFNPNPPEVVYTPNQCPSFTTFRHCQINPCPVRCKRFPAARCVTNPCGGCAPEWYQGGNRIIDCD
ncbi:neurogenic protein mastermind-like [Saccostrea echinata]|uniref:neurogenic protein mastermind-like n=1 Tax=Saccostrea echinata TaxID=191078 RepID=UPI002A83BB4C|nr:neurogenic protein mastermind-like [Saccostrea echinata]